MKRIGLLAAAAGSMLLLACGDYDTNPLAGADPVTDPPADTVRRGTETVNAGSIAFASTRGGRWNSPDIYLANRDGTGVRRLTLGTAPTWSPDDRKIAFRRDANAYDRGGIYIINADGSGERFLTVGWSPAWASDGQLAFSLGGGASNGSIALMHPDGGGVRHLLHGSSLVTDESCEDRWFTPHVDRPAWSPDSRRIAFVLNCFGEWSRLFVMNADGSDPRLLVDSWQAYAPAWSPDGSRIAATIDGAISVISLESGALQVQDGLGPRTKLDWSPDGRQIMFATGDWAEERIVVLALETGDVRQLIPGTPDFYADFDAAWSRVQP